MEGRVDIFWVIAATILTWVTCAGINYGIISQTLKDIRMDVANHNERIRDLEITDTRYMLKEEYERRHADLIRLISMKQQRND